MKNGEYSLAKDDFLQSLNLKPDQPEAYMNLAITGLELQDFPLSVQSMQRAIELGYNDTQGFLVLGLAYAKLGDFENERLARQRADQSIPVSSQSWIARGVSKAKTDPHAAINDLNAALLVNVHSLEAHESMAHILSELLGRTEEAIDVLNVAVQYFPEQGSILAARGVLRARLGDPSQARDDAKLAMELDASPAVQYQVAGIYALLGKDSMDDIQHAVALLSTSIRHGYGADLLDTDPDLEPIRGVQEFQALRDAVRLIGSHSAR